jgi:hypothetical protein
LASPTKHKYAASITFRDNIYVASMARPMAQAIVQL